MARAARDEALEGVASEGIKQPEGQMGEEIPGIST
jgi:hypothetical protein